MIVGLNRESVNGSFRSPVSIHQVAPFQKQKQNTINNHRQDYCLLEKEFVNGSEFYIRPEVIELKVDFSSMDPPVTDSKTTTLISVVDKRDQTIESSDDVGEDWEEWDGRSPFWAHCLAGSIAGVVEHAAIFPLDTVRTHIQVCAACLQRNVVTTSSSSLPQMPSASNPMENGAGTSLVRSSASASNQQPRLPLGMIQTIRYLVNEPILAAETAAVQGSTTAVRSQNVIHSVGSAVAVTHQAVAGWSRLFRGIQAVLVGCVPAHALYFSSYEMVKAAFLKEDGRASTIGSSLAGAAAVTSHDIIMTPLDTVKQRLQIGHYVDARHAARSIYQTEGFVALYRSFPITLLSNIPYGMVMVSTHEACKQILRDQLEYRQPQQQWQIVLLASSIAGFVASAVTTPLDRIKTALQTQELTPICGRRRQDCPLKNNSSTITTGTVRGTAIIASVPKHLNWHQAVATIWANEGVLGFWRGLLPRILSHTPAVAISWTTYETAKHYLLTLNA
jgi:solute carrier family 25 (mitochondrial iron transporter), member 28/37